MALTSNSTTMELIYDNSTADATTSPPSPPIPIDWLGYTQLDHEKKKKDDKIRIKEVRKNLFRGKKR